MKSFKAIQLFILVLIGGCASPQYSEIKAIPGADKKTSAIHTIYRVCVGEDPKECRTRFGQYGSLTYEKPQVFPPSLPGGPDDNQRIANNVCSRSGKGGDGARGVRLDTQDGGCCGYALIAVTCFDN